MANTAAEPKNLIAPQSPDTDVELHQAHLQEFEAPIQRQEFVRREFYAIIDDVLSRHCPAFRAWHCSQKENDWAEIPSEAVLLRSRYLTEANTAINAMRYAAHDDLQRKMEEACEARIPKLLGTRSEEVAVRQRNRKMRTSNK